MPDQSIDKTPRRDTIIRYVIGLFGVLALLIIVVRDIQHDAVQKNERGAHQFEAEVLQAGPPVVEATIEAVTLDEPGFVVVRDDLFGEPGVVVGASGLLPAGEAPTVTIPLTSQFSGQGKFYVMVYRDNGDGRFRQLDDQVVLNEAGSSIVQELILEQDTEIPIDFSY